MRIVLMERAKNVLIEDKDDLCMISSTVFINRYIKIIVVSGYVILSIVTLLTK